MTNNSLSMHIETGDIFYQTFNTGENFHNFILAQQDDETVPVPKRTSYYHSFEKYIWSFLTSFSIDDVKKTDLYAHKLQNICSIDLMTTLNCLVEKDKPSSII